MARAIPVLGSGGGSVSTAVTSYSGDATFFSWVYYNNSDSAQLLGGSVFIELNRQVNDGLQGGWGDDFFEDGFAYADQTWYFIAVVYDVTSKRSKVYRGTLASEMTEAVLLTDTAGTTAPTITSVVAGNANTTGGVELRFANYGLVKRQLSRDELERMRQGARYVPYDGDAIVLWPMDSPTVTNIEDMSGNGNHASVTNLAVVVLEDPPVAHSWGADGLVYMPTEPIVRSVLRATETDTARAFTRRKVLTIGQAQET